MSTLVTKEDITNWNSAYANTHVHKNKTVLDYLTLTQYNWLDSHYTKMEIASAETGDILQYDSTSGKMKNKHYASALGETIDLIFKANGTSTPSVTIINNSLPETFSVSRFGIGRYYIDYAGASTLNTFASNTSILQSTCNAAYIPSLAVSHGSRLALLSTDPNTGTLADSTSRFFVSIRKAP